MKSLELNQFDEKQAVVSFHSSSADSSTCNVVLQTRLPVVVAEVGHGREALGLGLAVAGGVEIRPPAGAGQKA